MLFPTDGGVLPNGNVDTLNLYLVTSTFSYLTDSLLEVAGYP